MDEVTPLKSFTVKSHYKFGISELTKKLMEARDKTRFDIKKAASPSQKSILMSKYIKKQIKEYVVTLPV